MAETLLTDLSNKILTITLNRPKKLNALTPTLLAELKAELDAAAKNEAVSVVILQSAGRAFCVGYDLNEENWITSQYPANFEHGVEIEQDKKDIMALLDYWLDMWRFPKPIICQVQGACLSGAGEMLAVSDLVVASEAASFGHPAGRDLGIPPTVFFWPLLIGMRKAKEMLYTARSMSADEALTAGLINQVVPAEELETATRALAEDIAKTPVNHLMILKQSANNFYDNMDMEKSTRQASDLDAEFHQSPVFLAFFKLVREKGMKAALTERARLFG
ncbi:enoyl-CoA hydratase/isomerase family protein [Hellea sp.]|nr:enoyl-CoA hydratase/isomerase family protein [Hellea sp.]